MANVERWGLFFWGGILTFSGLAKVAIFTTNVDAENQTLINHLAIGETEH
jgi:hypothetical protein